MRKLALLLCCCIVLLAPSLSIAQDSAPAGKLPAIIRAGLEAYKNGTAQAAVRAWIKGGPLDGSTAALSQANILNQIQDFYGAYRSYDVISTHDLTPRVKIVYLAVYFEKGPVYARFDLYREDSAWMVTFFNFNTKEDAVLPTAP